MNLKSVLLQNGSVLPSIHLVMQPIWRKHDNLKLLRYINDDQCQWQLCSNLKVVVHVMGVQGGYTRHCCVLGEWKSCARDSHCVVRDWSLCLSLEPGRNTFSILHLLTWAKFCYHPTHIIIKIADYLLLHLNVSMSKFMMKQLSSP